MIEKFYLNRSGNELRQLSNKEKQDIIKNLSFKFGKFQPEILNFICTLEKDKNINLNILYRNLRTLSIKTDDSLLKKLKLSDFLLKGKTLAYYEVALNQIVLSSNYHSNEFFHELFHTSSSGYLYQKNTNFCGISQRSPKTHINIGKYLNEGYTELLNERYFSANLSTSYCEEKNIAWAIEEIVGLKAMYNYYFNADLPGLINNLLKYDDEGNILLFLTSDIKKNIKKSLKKIYINKLQKDLSNSIITMEDFEDKLALFFYKLGYKKIDKECKNILNGKLSSSILNKFEEIRINQQNKMLKLVYKDLTSDKLT